MRTSMPYFLATLMTCSMSFIEFHGERQNMSEMGTSSFSVSMHSMT